MTSEVAMTTMLHVRTRTACAALLLALAGSLVDVPVAEARQSAQSRYMRALGRERELRDASSGATLGQLRSAVRAYEQVVLRYPASAYCDNALWQGGNLALFTFERFGQAVDRRTAVRLLSNLKAQYPSSSLVRRADEVLATMPPAQAAESTVPAESALPVAPAPITLQAKDLLAPPPAVAATSGRIVTIRDIKRTPLPDGVRVSIEMDGESPYRSERLDNPRRVFFDIAGTRATPSLQDATIRFDDDVVREIRLGRHPRNTTRVVMDLESIEDYSVFTLYNPFRLVIDFRRTGAAGRPSAASDAPGTPLPGRTAVPDVPPATASADPRTVPAAKDPVPLVNRSTGPPPISPAAPAANANGQFSLSRQLGLGISRIVLDAGHGGHDPGARSNGLEEAELVLDVTMRLKALLEKQPGIEVMLTRGTDIFVPLEERTAIANRTGADLFLSIHANASRNPRARGVETYFLNFASNPEAEAVAARENSASARSMHSLPDIVRAIALNNKIDESRDLADMVQKSMIRRLAARNKLVKDLGVKQAPFVVLIGAGMPSVLAEISFVTNKQESTLLKTPAYRQQIAESLLDGILRYQRSLKGVRTVASRE